MKIVGWVAAAIILSILSTSSAQAIPLSPPFMQCPAIGEDTSCAILIVFNSNGSITTLKDATQGPYDGSEDTLVGVQNNSTKSVCSLTLSSTLQRIFGFDG